MASAAMQSTSLSARGALSTISKSAGGALDDACRFAGVNSLHVIRTIAHLLPGERGALLHISIAQQGSHPARPRRYQQMNG